MFTIETFPGQTMVRERRSGYHFASLLDALSNHDGVITVEGSDPRLKLIEGRQCGPELLGWIGGRGGWYATQAGAEREEGLEALEGHPAEYEDIARLWPDCDA